MPLGLLLFYCLCLWFCSLLCWWGDLILLFLCFVLFYFWVVACGLLCVWWFVGFVILLNCVLFAAWIFAFGYCGDSGLDFAVCFCCLVTWFVVGLFKCLRLCFLWSHCSGIVVSL